MNPLVFLRHGDLDLLHHFIDGAGVIFCGRPPGHGHADVLRSRAQDSFRRRRHLKDHVNLFFRKSFQFGVELQDLVKVKPHLAEQPEEGKRLYSWLHARISFRTMPSTGILRCKQGSIAKILSFLVYYTPPNRICKHT